MVDLMSATYDMSKLISKYQHFRVPAQVITMEGKTLSKEAGLVGNVSITLSLGESSSVNFTIYDCYDQKARHYKSGVKSWARLGAKVSVQIGYGSSLTCVFEGYVGEISYELQDSPVIEVVAFDARRLMMEGDSRTERYQLDSYSGVLKEVLGRYSSLCSIKTLDKTTEEKGISIAQSTTDYHFIMNSLCPNANREFFILAGKAYFRKIDQRGSSMIDMEWGRDLISFSRRAKYQHTSIKVMGYDEKKKEVIEATAMVKATDSQKSLLTVESARFHPDASSQSKAKEVAGFKAKEEEERARSGHGVCIGLPEIVPGRFITIKKCDDAVDGKYYIKTVTHNISEDGFMTSFEVGGW